MVLHHARSRTEPLQKVKEGIEMGQDVGSQRAVLGRRVLRPLLVMIANGWKWAGLPYYISTAAERLL